MKKYNFKIGFIYAYHDNEYAGKFFLIDGQQRITTLYLLLFALYNKIGKRDIFDEFYFKKNNLKLDYKVREASHDFLQDFIGYKGANIENSSRYYKKEYEKDTTIINLLRNYNKITEFIESKTIDISFIDYVENFIEFNYFDTNISEQGEQLYLYVNSRGEHLSHQEKIRAELIKKEKTPSDKKKAGELWEDWQNYFWINRQKTEQNDTNADIGFEEFLKWASIIHIFTQANPNITKLTINGRKQSISEAKENYIHRVPARIEQQNKLLREYQINELNFSFLERVFNATKELFSNKSDYIPISKTWLFNGIDLSTINYVYFIPLIYFITENRENGISYNQQDIERLTMFLKNITHFTVNSKNPDRTVVISMDLVKMLIEDREIDITYFLNKQFDNKFKSVLTNFERQKLNELTKLNSSQRPILEEFLWKVYNDRDFSEFIEGNMSFIFDYVNEEIKYDLVKDIYDKTIVDRMDILYKIFKGSFYDYKDNDLFRQALLSFGDYSIDDNGGSGHIDGWKDRYSFCIDLRPDKKEWERLLNSEFRNRKIAFKFIKEIEPKFNSKFSFEDFYKKCVKNYSDTDWKEPFIKYTDLLEYTNKKRFLFYTDVHDIVLLKNTKASNAVYIQIILATVLIKKLSFYVYEYNTCYADFYFDKKTSSIVDDENEDNYWLEIEYDVTNTLFKYHIGYNPDNKTKALSSLEKGIWQKKEDYYIIDKKRFTKYDKSKSIIDNIKKLRGDVNKIIKEIEKLLK